MSRRPLILLALAVVPLGCESDTPTLSGKVYEYYTPRGESYAVVSGPQAIPAEATPLSGVRIYLSNSADGDPVDAKADITSADDGSFKMVLASNMNRKEVFLIMKKDGYAPLSVKMTIGPLNPYNTSWSLLKREKP